MNKKPNRKLTVASNKPELCDTCLDKTCLLTMTPCKAVELWISQDYVGGTSMELLQNKPTRSGINMDMDHADLVNYYHNPVIPDRDIATAAWAKVKTLRLSESNLEILRLYYKEGKRNCECALELGLRDQTVHERRKAAKRAVGDRLRRLEYWENIKGSDFKIKKQKKIAYFYFKCLYTRREISDMMNATIKTIGVSIKNTIKSFG